MINTTSGWALQYKGKFWGLLQKDGHSSVYGWVDDSDINAICIDTHTKNKPPTKAWFTHNNSTLISEINKGEWVKVSVVTKLEVLK